MQATAADIPNSENIKPEKLEKKLNIIHEGGQLAQENEIFPDSRSCNDCWCILLFGIFVLGMLGTSIWGGSALIAGELNATSVLSPTVPPTVAPPTVAPPVAAAAAAPAAIAPAGYVAPIAPAAAAAQSAVAAPARRLQLPAQNPYATPAPNATSYFDAKDVKVEYLVIGTLCGAVGGFMAVLLLVFLSKSCAKCVVYTSLLFSCAMLIVMGIAMLATGAASASTGFGVIYMLFGGLMVFMGLCFGTCILCCWFGLIEFTAHVVEVCGTVTLENCGMFVVSMLMSVKSAIWSLIVAIAFVGVLSVAQTEIMSSRYVAYGVFGLFFFIWIWAVMVFSGIAYTTFCGVFGRWYFSNERPDLYDSPLCPSFCAACTTSLGSIIFGTGLVAAVRTSEFVARMCQEDAMRDGNFVLCILLCCVRCIIECIGDILEFFNEWAYVQCALRNSAFCEAAKIVFSMCTLANIWALWASLLIESVVNFGGFMAAFLGAGIGAGIGYIGSPQTAMVGAICGLIAGQAVGWCCMCVFSAGSKTLLTCWAEHPETLFHKAQETDLAEKFQEKLGGFNRY